MTPALVASLQSRGVRYVLGYISIGEDAAPAALPGDGSGPVFHDGTALVFEHTGVASFHVDQRWNGGAYESDGIADVYPGHGGRYVHPNPDWRWVLNEQRVGGSIGLPRAALPASSRSSADASAGLMPIERTTSALTVSSSTRWTRQVPTRG